MAHVTVARIKHPNYRILVNLMIDGSMTFDERVLDPILEWCKANDMGRRLSWDQIGFNTEQELSAFMLRWNDAQI